MRGNEEERKGQRRKRKIQERKNKRTAFWFHYEIITESNVGAHTEDYYYYVICLFYCIILYCTVVLVLGCSWPCLAVSSTCIYYYYAGGHVARKLL
jgi:hypothetical protein